MESLKRRGAVGRRFSLAHSLPLLHHTLCMLHTWWKREEIRFIVERWETEAGNEERERDDYGRIRHAATFHFTVGRTYKI